jgi:tRNA pseudouridine13 synthase
VLGKPGFTLPDWQCHGEIPTATGLLRCEPQDFKVVEIPGFSLTGDGEHDYLYIEKINANTPWVARGLARSAGVPVRDVGFAGMKDRHAVTRQWFSVRRPGGVKADWERLDLEGVSVLEVRRHNRKLRRGSHRANHFQLRIRALADSGSVVGLGERLRRIAAMGVPNYFGEQRFGREGRNIDLARRCFAGERMPRGQRSIALSAARSLLFNNVLSARVVAADWNRLRDGDVANLNGSGSIFPVPTVDAELQRRCDEFDIHPTGVLWGKGAPTTTGCARDTEQRIADLLPDLANGLERNTDEGRRALRLEVQDLEWDLLDDSLILSFSLTRGGFATAVLRELVSYRTSQ